MSQKLVLEQHYIANLAHTASHRYRKYFIPKQKGGLRKICHPSKELKALQRWLLSHILQPFPVHDVAMAYRKGQNITTNARSHQNSSFLLRMDFDDFFPSLTWEDIELHLETHKQNLPAGWSDQDSTLFCSIVCRKRQLTIGAVTSPSLSNTLCYELDQRLARMAEELDVTYSRYADDLYFSTIKPKLLSNVEQKLPGILEGLDYPRLNINKSKTYRSSKKGNRTVTGLVLTSDGNISLGRGLKRRIRSRLYKWNDLNEPERKSFAGLLAFCKGVEPDFINRLIIKYGFEVVRRAQRPWEAD